MRSQVLGAVSNLLSATDEVRKKGHEHLTAAAAETVYRVTTMTLRAVDSAMRALPLGPDEWRVPPGAPNPDSLPVEDLPGDESGEIRVWNSDPETVAAEFTLLPSEARETTFSAWRPAAVGPGGE